MTLENVINKLNNIILPKIKRSADFSSLKFSTIFTKNNYNVLTNKINYHYNKIYDYVSENYTTIISNYMNQFLDELNNTHAFTNVMNNLGFNIIMEMLERIQELINEKMTLVNDSLLNINIPKMDITEGLNETINETNYNNYIQFLNTVKGQFDKAQRVFNEIEQNIKDPILEALDTISFINNTNFLETLSNNLGLYNSDFLLWVGFHAREGKNNTYVNLLSLDTYISQITINMGTIVFPFFPFFQIRPITYLNDIMIHLDLKLNLVYKDTNKYLVDMKEVQILSNIRVKSYSETITEMGFFFPIGIGEMYLAFELIGLLGDYSYERALALNFLKNTYIYDLKYNLYEVDFIFSLKVGIHIDLGIISFSLDFYIFFLIIPLLNQIDLRIYQIYSYRDKSLKSSGSALLKLFGFAPEQLNFIPNLIDKNELSRYID
jgi:hypothetical protein